MDFLERFHQKFGGWYEKLFGDMDRRGIRPKDVLRKIISEMEANRNEGLDGKIYVPNKYVLELAVANEDERDYLLSFLDEEELSAVLQRYMAQNGYATRGPLDFTIQDIPREEAAEKLIIKARFEKGPAELPQPVAPAATKGADDDLPTVAPIARNVYADEPTVAAPPVAWASLAVTGADGQRRIVSLTKQSFIIGRSRNVGNDLVLGNDGQVSKRHARIDREPDGLATLFDLGSMNGTQINHRFISTAATLKDGDEILVGQTTILFQQTRRASDGGPNPPGPRRRARLVPSKGGLEHMLASETLIGRAITSDIVIDEPRVSTRQAQIIAPDSNTYYVEDLAGQGTTLVNGATLKSGDQVTLADGDRVQFGDTLFEFLDTD